MSTTAPSVPSVDFIRGVVRQGKPLVIAVTTTTCGPCNAYKPIFHKVGTSGSIDAFFGVADYSAAHDVAAFFNIQRVPTTLILVDGREVGRHLGPMSEPALRRWVETTIASR